MSTTSSLMSNVMRDIAGALPPDAITEWLFADASSEVLLDEDPVGNLVGDPIGNEKFTADTPVLTLRRAVKSHHRNARTNWDWCRAEMKEHNRFHPNSPWVIWRSTKNQKWICLRRAQKGELDSPTQG